MYNSRFTASQGIHGDHCSYCPSLSLSAALSQDQMVGGEGAEHQDPLHLGHSHPVQWWKKEEGEKEGETEEGDGEREGRKEGEKEGRKKQQERGRKARGKGGSQISTRRAKAGNAQMQVVIL